MPIGVLRFNVMRVDTPVMGSDAVHVSGALTSVGAAVGAAVGDIVGWLVPALVGYAVAAHSWRSNGESSDAACEK